MDVCEIGPERDVEVVTLIRRAWAARVDPRSGGHRFTFDDLRSERARGASVIGVLGDRALIGTATLHRLGDELHLDSLAAEPSRPRTGIGSALLEAAANRGRGQRARRLTLDVSTLQPDLVRWYVRQGFVVAPDRFRVTDSGRTTIAMVRQLDASPVPDPVGDAVRALKGGALIGLPTETVYGLAADASDPIAVRSVFAAKGRPVDHPLIVHFARGSQPRRLGDRHPGGARRLAAELWPGPLTMVLRRASHVLDEVTGGRDTVALRVPGHALALAVLGLHGGGLAAPSANLFGKVSPTTAADVRADLGDRVALVLDGGPATLGVESTISTSPIPDDPRSCARGDADRAHRGGTAARRAAGADRPSPRPRNAGVALRTACGCRPRQLTRPPRRRRRPLGRARSVRVSTSPTPDGSHHSSTDAPPGRPRRYRRARRRRTLRRRPWPGSPRPSSPRRRHR